MESFNLHRKPFLGLAVLALIAGCETTGYQRSSFAFIVEGNEKSYPAFEAAAKACRYTAFWRFPGSKTKAITAGPHFKLSRTKTPEARCAIKWVEDHPETGLILSSE